MKKHLTLTLLALLSVPILSWAAPTTFELYSSGQVNEAKAQSSLELERARTRNSKSNLWMILMQAAWLEHVTGDYQKSIPLANEALETASSLKDPFMIGRSLCWLGWSYAGLGHYQAAEEFYEAAIELSSKGEQVLYPAVWGLATQEYAALLFKMGSTDDAKTLLTKTIQFAEQFNVLVGLAEGNYHLAEILINSGDAIAAIEVASAAVKAAYECNCGHFNTARALYIEARALSEFSERRLEAKEKTEAVIEFSRRHQVAPVLADALVLYSKLLPAKKFDLRQTLLNEAVEIVTTKGLQQEARTLSELGAFLAASEYNKMAKLYLKQGLELSEEKLIVVDQAFILKEQAVLDRLEGQQREAQIKLIKAYDTAQASLQIEQAAEAATILATEFYQQGAVALAAKWSKAAIDNYNILLERNSEYSELNTKRRLALLKMQELFITSRSFLSPSASAPEMN